MTHAVITRLSDVLAAMVRGLGRLLRDARASVPVEAALTIPMVAGLLMSGIETGRFILVNQKVDRSAAVLSDLVSQSQSINTSNLDDMFAAVSYVMDPFYDDERMALIVSSVLNDGGTSTVAWQASHGSLAVGSRVGVEGGTPTLPSGFVLRDGENVIVAEVFYDYRPVIAPDAIAAAVVDSAAYFRPRLAPLRTLVVVGADP